MPSPTRIKHKDFQDPELGFDLPVKCANGWVVEQAHLFGTGPDVQESLLGPAELARRPKRLRTAQGNLD